MQVPLKNLGNSTLHLLAMEELASLLCEAGL